MNRKGGEIGVIPAALLLIFVNFFVWFLVSFLDGPQPRIVYDQYGRQHILRPKPGE